MRLRIKEVLIERAMTLTALADAVGIEKGNLSAIANGKKNPTIDTLDKIANGLGVHITSLFEKPEPNNGGFTCPNCGATFEVDIRMTGEPKMPDHENIRGKEYYK